MTLGQRWAYSATLPVTSMMYRVYAAIVYTNVKTPNK